MNKKLITAKISELRKQNVLDFLFEEAIAKWIFEEFDFKKPKCETRSKESIDITKLQTTINGFNRKSNQGFDYDELHLLLKLFPTVNKREFFNEFQTTDFPSIYAPQQVFDAFYKCLNF